MFKTVEVLALESRIAELERENALLRDNAGLWPRDKAKLFSSVESEDMRPIDFTFRDVKLFRTAAWDVRRDWRTGQMHAVGSCKVMQPAAQQVGVSYYHESMEGLSRELALDVLGRLHERTIRELANLWWQPSKQPA